MQVGRIQELCTAISNETDLQKLIALIKELRTLLAEQQAAFEAKLAKQPKAQG